MERHHDLPRVSLGQTQMRRCVPATRVLVEEELDNDLEELTDVEDDARPVRISGLELSQPPA